MYSKQWLKNTDPYNLYRNFNGVLKTNNLEKIKDSLEYIETGNFFIDYQNITCLYVEQFDKLPIARYLIKKCYNYYLDKVCRSCAKHNRIEILKYLKGLGINFDEEILYSACESGVLTIAKYVLGYVTQYDYNTVIKASIEGGNKEIHDLFKSKGTLQFKKEYILKYALKGGNIDLIKEYISPENKGQDLTKYCAVNGKLEALKWCISNDYCIPDNYIDTINYVIKETTKLSKNHWKCIYFLIKCQGNLLGEIGDNVIDLEFFDIDNEYVRTYLFQYEKLPQNMKKLIEEKKSENKLRLEYIMTRSTISTDVIKFIIGSFL